MDHIVERLREHIAVVIDNKGHVFEDEHLCDIAADRIEALEARIAKVREEALREVLDAAREYRYRRGEAVENAILALIEKDAE